MTNRRAAESVMTSLDPECKLQKNSRHLYKDSLIKIMDNISNEVAYARKKSEEQQKDVIRFAKWCTSQCPVLEGLSIFLEQDGELQCPHDALWCQCGPDAPFCSEFSNEYEFKLRMNKKGRTVIHLHYVFAQTQLPPNSDGRIRKVEFDDCDCVVKKNVMLVNYFPGRTADEVLAAIREFISMFCDETVKDFVDLPTARDESPMRH